MLTEGDCDGERPRTLFAITRHALLLGGIRKSGDDTGFTNRRSGSPVSSSHAGHRSCHRLFIARGSVAHFYNQREATIADRRMLLLRLRTAAQQLSALRAKLPELQKVASTIVNSDAEPDRGAGCLGRRCDRS